MQINTLQRSSEPHFALICDDVQGRKRAQQHYGDF